MAIEGVDYSFSPPTPAELKAAGKQFAVRYIGTAWNQKNLTKAEADALRAVGIDLVANYEGGSAGWMKGGYDVGVAAAKAAHADATGCGMPAGRPIFFSQDEDWRGLSGAQQQAVMACCDGAASVIGRGRVGAYGGYYFMVDAFNHGKITWGWQTYAWSGGLWHPRAVLQQYRNNVALGSGEVDLCRATAADYGQWPAGTITPEVDIVTADDIKAVAAEVVAQLGPRIAMVDEAVAAKLAGPAFAGYRFDEGALTLTELLGKYGATSISRSALAKGIALAVRASEVPLEPAEGEPLVINLGEATPQQLRDLGAAVADRLAVLGIKGSISSEVMFTPAPPASPA
jgi:hypothetical protein